MSKRSKPGFLNNVYFFSVLTRIYLILIGIAISALQISFLGKELNGHLGYIASTSTLLNNVFVFGVHQAYSYYKKRSPENFKEYYLGSCLVLFLIYCFIALTVFFSLSLDFDLSVITLSVPLFFLSRVPKSRNIILIVVNTLLIAVLICMHLFFHASFRSVVILAVFEKTASLVLYLYKLRVRPRIDRNCLTLLFKLMSFGFFPMMGLVLNSINYRIDVVMLKALTTYSSISVYTTGVNISEQCWAIPDTIRDILLSKLTDGKDKSEVRMVLRVSNTLTLFIQLGLLLLGRFMIYILYGPDYNDSFWVLTISMLGSYGMIYTKMIVAYNVVEGRQKTSLGFMFITAALNIIANYFLIPKIGIFGAALASVISYNISGLMFIVYFNRTTGSHIKDMLFIRKKDIANILNILRSSSKKQDL